jgi:hypothetical protein
MCSRGDGEHLQPVAHAVQLEPGGTILDPVAQPGDWLYPKGDRPLCRQCGAEPMYLAGLCSACWAGTSWAQEHRDTRGDHYGLNGPGSSASTKCPMCGGRGENSPQVPAENA